MKKVILSVIGTLVVLFLIFLVFIYSGMYDVSQASRHTGFTRWAINTTTEHSIEKRMKDVPNPPDLNDTNLIVLGFKHYNGMCAGCHGAPGMEQWELAKGLYPDPPTMYKFSDKMDPKGTFWVIKNGIKFTGMPAYGPTHDDQKIWAMTAFLIKKLHSMTPAEYQEWSKKYQLGED